MGKKSKDARYVFVIPSLEEVTGYKVKFRVIPIAPRIARAIPISLGSKARPPVKFKGGFCTFKLGGSGCVGSNLGVDRKVNHRLLNVPIWKARMLCERRVKMTVLVHMRRKGSFWRTFCPSSFFGDAGVAGVAVEVLCNSKLCENRELSFSSGANCV